MKRILLVAILCLIGILAAVAQESLPAAQRDENALPRFVSLRSSPVNARSGPGVKYPIEWVYLQKSAPVEIIAEFEDWRRIKDWQGYDFCLLKFEQIEGWMLRKNLYGIYKDEIID